MPVHFPLNPLRCPHHHLLRTFPSLRSSSFAATAYVRPQANPIDPPPSSPPSSLHVGTSYEYLCARTLPLLGFTSLIRTGGRSDRGIDLLAQWTLPSSAQSPSLFDAKNTLQSQHKIRTKNRVIKALIQCKAHARKPGPDMIRELEGAVSGVEREEEEGVVGVVGVLCAKREATAGVREAVRRCRRGVVWVMVEDSDEASERGEEEEGVRVKGEKVDGEYEGRVGRIKQILWNEKVGRMMGGGVATGVRYMPETVKGKGAWWKEVVLMVDGRLWVPDGLGMEQGQEELEGVEGLLVNAENRFGTG